MTYTLIISLNICEIHCAQQYYVIARQLNR